MRLTYSKRLKGSNNKTFINVSKDNEPYGQIYTWQNTKTDQHPWHGKKTTGEHFSSYGDDNKSEGLHDVIDWMNKQ
jgi:hypothetical protein